MKPSSKNLGLLSILGQYFVLCGGRSRAVRSHRVPTNHRLPKEVQKQIIAKAQAKRERKMARPQGRYNG